ncbi:hypothetical protein F3Y22_tig00116964pilonHSYRG00158 [Hibiscus syriacus]|uniref:Peptidase C1A papain C-terminal domain-containing protein n=1 Tax=Hibiscus syriacus TaxID=106335 RepID=A0A6A2WVF3_HIBSY|nr:hypothetical protein F3Y22_tig00116964pilonHSYRG00158 [Hibiscus syriacus]
MKNSNVVRVDSYEDVPPAYQPVRAAIEAGGRSFQLYTSGVFKGICGTQLDHGVVDVGYGKDYRIVKKSWGDQWGESGYIRMERNLGNTATGKCGIAMEASYPIKKAVPAAVLAAVPLSTMATAFLGGAAPLRLRLAAMTTIAVVRTT